MYVRLIIKHLLGHLQCVHWLVVVVDYWRLWDVLFHNHFLVPVQFYVRLHVLWQLMHRNDQHWRLFFCRLPYQLPYQLPHCIPWRLIL